MTQFSGKTLFAWIDRDGQSHDFMATNTSNVCDLKLPERKSDFMVVTDIRKLPIMGYKYGPLRHSSENGNVTIGPLICEPENMAENSLIEELSQNFMKKLVLVEENAFIARKEMIEKFHIDFAAKISTLKQDISYAKNSIKDDLTQRFLAEISMLKQNMSYAKNSVKDNLTKKISAEISTLKKDMSKARNSLKYDLDETLTAEISSLNEKQSKTSSKIETIDTCSTGNKYYRMILGECFYFEKKLLSHEQAVKNCQDNYRGILFEPRTLLENNLVHDVTLELKLADLEGSYKYSLGINLIATSEGHGQLVTGLRNGKSSGLKC